ncbi:SusC/RagA family TonB-linked outer membrane protein, partial [bacterium]|nr:SusC/RagA family TonB-linked outer membrane protein [bacterium]
MNLSACLFLLMALNVYASGSDSQSAMAQDQTVTGKVLDETGAPLPGVSIMIQGTTRGAVTNLEGEYTIQVPDPSTTVLVFSFVGYLTQEISISDQTTIDIAMEPDIYGVEEVVVIGYGTQKKVNLTGSVSAIEGDQLAKQPVFQSSQALVGLAPGLTAIQSSSQPGKDAATLLIRGVGSLTASNNPLVLIDGIEGDINGVDANDIESISVLKDASASSIYGSRASNGVILVTTNRAKSGELSVNYRNWFGWQKATETPQYLGALDFMKYSGYDQAVIDDYAANLGDPDRYPDTDWYAEQITESGFQQYHQISLNGGTENVRTLASFSYMDQGANVVNFNYKRYNGRLNTDIKFSDKFDMNFDVSFRRSITTEPSIGLTWIFQAISRIPPIYTARYSDGSWGEGWDGNNPIAFAN